MPILANQYCANVGKSILVQHRHQYWVILVTILVQYTDGLRFSYIVPILANQYCANVGKSILVQHYNQYWVNIATNIGAIPRWTTVYLYCTNIGKPILCQCRQINIGPTSSPILGQYCSQYRCNIRMDDGFPILCQYWQTNIMPTWSNLYWCNIVTNIGSIL